MKRRDERRWRHILDQLWLNEASVVADRALGFTPSPCGKLRPASGSQPVKNRHIVLTLEWNHTGACSLVLPLHSLLG
jgi:hypothetical protein